MSIFDEINKAKVFGSGQYFGAGEYLVTVNSIKFLDGYKARFFIVECLVDESDNPNCVAGRSYSYVINLDRKETGPGNVKAFLAQALGEDPENEEINWGALAQKACSEENPMGGLQLKLSAFERKTKEGGTYTVHKFERV